MLNITRRYDYHYKAAWNYTIKPNRKYSLQTLCETRQLLDIKNRKGPYSVPKSKSAGPKFEFSHHKQFVLVTLAGTVNGVTADSPHVHNDKEIERSKKHNPRALASRITNQLGTKRSAAALCQHNYKGDKRAL